MYIVHIWQLHTPMTKLSLLALVYTNIYNIYYYINLQKALNITEFNKIR